MTTGPSPSATPRSSRRARRSIAEGRARRAGRVLRWTYAGLGGPADRRDRAGHPALSGPAGTAVGIVSDLWRFPVKSFGGERVRRAFLGPFGILGDRRHAVVDAEGNALTARRAHALLGFRAALRRRRGRRGRARSPRPRAGSSPGTTRASPTSSDARSATRCALARSAVGRPRRGPGPPADQRLADGRAGLGRRARRSTGAASARTSSWSSTSPSRSPRPAGSGARWRSATSGPVLEVVSPTERCAITTFDPDTLERDNRVLAGPGARAREPLRRLRPRRPARLGARRAPRSRWPRLPRP